MAKLIVPSYLKGKTESKKEENKSPALDRVPKATGWRIVVLPHKGIEKTKPDSIVAEARADEFIWFNLNKTLFEYA